VISVLIDGHCRRHYWHVGGFGVTIDPG